VAREDLFGSLPEPPTESGPALPVLDEAGPASALLQAPEAAFAQWPRDGRGKPDWVRALRDGAIQPRAEVRGDGAMQVLDLDIVMKNTAQMPYVRFPHQAHALWLACSNCHDALFAPKAGANAITMSGILRGETCGVCHGTVAFTALFTCERCHSVLQPGQQRWW
jgi:c(7)-type cytochrome triheme protein